MRFWRSLSILWLILWADGLLAFEVSFASADGVAFADPVLDGRYMFFDLMNTGERGIAIAVIDCVFLSENRPVKNSVGLVVFVAPGEKKQPKFRLPDNREFDTAECAQGYVRRR